LAEALSGEPILPHVGNLELIVTTTIVLFTGLFASSISSAVSGDPSLPDVKITLIDSGQTVEGKLLDHSGGAWHFFDEEWTLKAIPDGQVKVADVYEKSDHYTANDA
jgi:hypothetical protein